MTYLEIISISVLLGLYLAPVAFITSRYGTGVGVAAGLSWVFVAVFAASVYGGGMVCMSNESFEILKSAAHWYNAQVAERQEVQGYIDSMKK